MCRYCDSNILDALAINSKDEAVIINQDTETGEYFIDGLDERVYIDYCPMCRKEARMNTLKLLIKLAIIAVIGFIIVFIGLIISKSFLSGYICGVLFVNTIFFINMLFDKRRLGE